MLSSFLPKAGRAMFPKGNKGKQIKLTYEDIPSHLSPKEAHKKIGILHTVAHQNEQFNICSHASPGRHCPYS